MKWSGKFNSDAYDSTEFLDVVLHERIESLPAERARELLGADRLLGELEVVEDSLKRVRHALELVVVLGGHLVNRFAKFVREEQCL